MKKGTCPCEQQSPVALAQPPTCEDTEKDKTI